jgi:biopolymer transport protein ExbD
VIAMAGGVRELDEDEIDEQHEINVTPFIDVMLVLLIIFMVAAPLSTVDIPVELPVSAAKAQSRPEKPVFVTIKRNLELAVGEATMSSSGLVGALEAATSGNRDTRLYLRADKSVPYGELMRVMDLLRSAGFLKVGLVGLERSQGPGATVSAEQQP